jgi:heat shock protein HtpX
MNERRSGRVVAGMVLLLVLCGWVSGGDDGAQKAVNGGVPAPGGLPISPDAMRQRFGARLLHPSEMPALFQMVEAICRRARLPRLPDLYLLPDRSSMNAYALGGPEHSAITLTEGLLTGMTRAEIAAILAHEIAHIRNDDGWAMSLATGLHRAIAVSSITGLMSLPSAPMGFAHSHSPLAMVLHAAPALGELLYLALSRIRELDADALALELTDDPTALATALEKLERHHSRAHEMPVPAVDDSLSSYLRSHPATWQRVSILNALAR